MIKTPLFLVNNETEQLGSQVKGLLNRNYFNITSQSSLNSHDPNRPNLLDQGNLSENARNFLEQNNQIKIC